MLKHSHWGSSQRGFTFTALVWRHWVGRGRVASPVRVAAGLISSVATVSVQFLSGSLMSQSQFCSFVTRLELLRTEDLTINRGNTNQTFRLRKCNLILDPESYETFSYINPASGNLKKYLDMGQQNKAYSKNLILLWNFHNNNTWGKYTSNHLFFS